MLWHCSVKLYGFQVFNSMMHHFILHGEVITQRQYPFVTINLTPPPFTASPPPHFSSVNHQTIIYAYWVFICLSCLLVFVSHKWDKSYSSWIFLTNFAQHDFLKIYPCCPKWQNFILQLSSIPLLYWIIYWRTLHLLPCLGNHE